jgi:hypothetical protein
MHSRTSTAERRAKHNYDFQQYQRLSGADHLLTGRA